MSNKTSANTGAIRNRSKYWTEEEEAILLKLAPTKTSAEIAEVLERTKDGVRGRARKLGISLQKIGENHSSARHDNATIEKVGKLRQQGLFPKEISRETGLPIGTIRSILFGQIRVREYMKGSMK